MTTTTTKERKLKDSPKRVQLKKALGVGHVLQTKHNHLPFEHQFKDSFGMPVLSGCWLIWAPSGSGKTTFVTMLMKYLSAFGKIYFNSLEEKASPTILAAYQRVNMSEAKGEVLLVPGEGFADMRERLKRNERLRVCVIDSLQYLFFTWEEFLQLKREHPKVLFIFVSQADGKEPKGDLAKRIRYDSDIKIRVEGYRAFVNSRFGGGKPFDIWAEEAERYWAGINSKN